MRPYGENDTSGKWKRRNAHSFAQALGQGRPWSGLPVKRRIGIVLFILGTIALPFAFVSIEPGGWFWGLGGLFVMIVGGALGCSGVDLERSGPPWPPYSG
jgi:hypothetical protein